MAGGVQRFTSSINYGSGGSGDIGYSYGFIAIGYFKPPTTGNYTFGTRSDDGSGVWIGDIAVATSGRTTGNANVNNGLGIGQGTQTYPVAGTTISLNADTWYAIRIVHEEGSGADGLAFYWSSNGGSTWNTDLSQYFKVPAPDGSGSYNYTSTSSGILTMGSGSGGMDVGVHSNMSSSTSALAITYPITVQRANGSQTSLNLIQNLTKAVSGTSGTSYYMSPSAAAVRQAADGSYTPTTVSFPTYSSVSGSNPTLLSSYYKLYLNGSGTATSTSGPTQSFSYTPTGNITSIRVESYLDSGYQTKIADLTVPVTADGSRGSLTGYGNKYGFVSGSWVDEVANRVINNMLTGSSDTSYMYSTSHLRVGDTVTLSGNQNFAQTKFWTGSQWIVVGTVLDGNLLVNGTIAAEAITAGTITADRLKVTGRGGATILSDDPYFQDSTVWTRTSSNISFLSGTGASGAVSSYYVSCTYGTDQTIESTRYYQIDPNKTYNLSCNLFAAANNNRNIYIYVEFFTAAGTYLGHSVTGWGGSKSGYVYGGQPSTSVFTRQGGRFGVGVNGRSIPSNAVQCRIGVWFQYAEFGYSQVEQAAQDLRLDEVLDGSTYIKNINADSITSGTLNIAGSIRGGGYTEGNWPAAGLSGYYLGAGGLLMGNYNNNGQAVQFTSDGTYFYMGGGGKYLQYYNGNLNVTGNVNLNGTLNCSGAGGSTVQLGTVVGGGHYGLSLSSTDYDNIFLRRNDGVAFFRLSGAGGAGHTLGWDSSSGVLAVGGDVIATGNVKAENITVPRGSEGGFSYAWGPGITVPCIANQRVIIMGTWNTGGSDYGREIRVSGTGYYRNDATIVSLSAPYMQQGMGSYFQGVGKDQYIVYYPIYIPGLVSVNVSYVPTWDGNLYIQLVGYGNPGYGWVSAIQAKR